MNMSLGEKLQRLRKARGWTQEQLSEKLGVSRQSLSKWESDAALPDTVHVVALADLFGVTTDYLLRDTKDLIGTQPSAQVNGAPAGQPGWRGVMSPRELGARLMIGASAAGLCVVRIMSSFYPAEVHIDDRHYTGFSGFLQFYDLWWLVYLLLAVLAAGLVQLLGPWALRKTKQLINWLKQDDGETADPEA